MKIHDIDMIYEKFAVLLVLQNKILGFDEL